MSVINSKEDADKPPLYTKIFEVLQCGSPISKELFEVYGSIIAAFASITVLKNKSGYFGLDGRNISELEGIPRIDSAVRTQNPLVGQKSEKLSKRSLLSQNPIGNSKIMFLTPDQQKALKGPPRQFIIGAAGTGKTIVLQAKAIELLSKDQSVLILTTEHFLNQYKTLLGKRNLEVRSSKFELIKIFGEILTW